MSDEVEEIKEKISNNIICLGLDFGTMNIVCSRSDSDDIKIIRNVFLKVNKEDISINELSNISYVENEDNELFIIGEDAFRFANIFGQKISRPMEKGLISPKEISAIDVLTLMIKDLIGDIKDKEIYCSFSVPAEAVDEERSVVYHKNVFSRILNSLGLNHTAVNEAMAIIYSECAQENFSGVAISYGAGMANCLSGETKIPLLNGQVKSLKELTDEYKGEKFWIYSCKQDGTIIPGLAHSPRKTGTKQVIRIYLDNDTYFDCTEDHLIMKRDGEYIEASKLKENDSLMPLYTENSKWNEMLGYLSYYHNKHKHWEMVHSMVAREELGANRKRGYIIHHKNFNKVDNTPENLIQLTREDHYNFHKEISSIGGKAAGKITREKRLGKTNEEIYGFERANEISKNISAGILNSTSGETIKKQRSGKTNDEIFGKEKSKYIKEKQSKKKMGLKYEEIMNNKDLINKRKSELSKKCSEQKPWLYRKEMINNGTFKEGSIPWNKGITGNEYLNHFKDGMQNQYTKNPSNHKVIKIEKLNIEKDVYDLTIDKYHNFAIENGIFVHNCVVSFKGLEALTFSAARSGDWIDNMVAADLDMVPNRVTSIKEKYLNLNGNVEIKDKKIKRVLEALFYYHKALIEYTVKELVKQFNEKSNIQIEGGVPIIVSGGTSMPQGFLELFKSVITSYELPFEISEIRAAKNPLTAVANGLLIRTIADTKSIK